MINPNYEYKDGKIKVKIDETWIEPKFDRYKNIEPIGEPGANGVVIKGTHKVTGREEAIKIWLPREKNGKNIVRKEQYTAEVQKIAKIKDPRIVTIHDAWKENGCYCSSMDFVDGITYEKWLERNYDINTRIIMLEKIFEAIVFYQTEGIIHGDIHSRNILIDGKDEIHIIDFGTSIFSAYAEQSNHRENFLMYELVEKTLVDKFDDKVFLYKKYKPRGNIKHIDDIRNVEPIFFSQSVLCYLHLMTMLINIHDIINDSEYVYEYCRYIAKGFYLSMDYFYLNLPGENEYKLEKFTNVMYAALEDEDYESAQDNFDEAERLEFISLFAYFEAVKKGLSIGDVKSEVMEKYIDGIFISKDVRTTDIINSSNDLFELNNFLINIIDDYEDIYSIHRDLRIALYNVIKETYQNYLLHIHRELHLRMADLKRQKKLYDKIIKMSYIYCLNNGIEYPSSES